MSTKTKTKKTKKPKTPAAPKGTSSPMHSTETVIKALSGKDFTTAVQLAAELKVTKTTAQVYLKKLGKARKIETKLVRQGLRGPKAIGFRIRVR
jgi:predicted ArsR family transcriptional regulator